MGANEKLVSINGSDICVEAFGDAADPAVLLIGGAASSMDWWEDPICRRIAAAGRQVIRYDHRDTGRSTAYPPGAPAYTFPDLVSDALGVLDAFDIRRAHVVGLSMGGMIAQLLALDHADRVLSLTLIATSPAGPGGPDNPDLPEMDPKVMSEPPPDPNWADRDAVVESLVVGEMHLFGSLPVDVDRIRAIAGAVVDRSESVQSASNHFSLQGGETLRPRLSKISAPTLVLHGTEDPLFPYGHGEALAAEIPGARLVPLVQMGHQYPPPELWDVFVDSVIEHTGT